MTSTVVVAAEIMSTTILPPCLTAKRVYILENLGCAHCASKMEERIQALEGVESATITFATKQLQQE